MGAIMGEYDTHIPSFQHNFNMRFAPEQTEQHARGGIAEMKELHNNFKIFQPGRSFADSCRILGLGSHRNNDAKNRWFKLLRWLKTCPSDESGVDGDQRIVSAMIGNLERAQPLPCFMTSHDGNTDPRVLVFREARPLHYMRQGFLTISLPLQPRPKDEEPSDQTKSARGRRERASSQKKGAASQKRRAGAGRPRSRS